MSFQGSEIEQKPQSLLHTVPALRTSARLAKRKQSPAEEVAGCDRWERCTCGTWLSIGDRQNNQCHNCGQWVDRADHMQLQCWVQCDACGKWRATSAELASELEACGPEAQWFCWHMGGGSTCRTSALEWGPAVRKAARQQQRSSCVRGLPQQLSQRHAPDGGLQHCTQHWQLHVPPVSSLFPEFIPGRDLLLTTAQLVAGMDAVDTQSGEHLLWATGVPASTIAAAAPAALRVLQLHAEGVLKESADGRASAGPLDMAAFLAQPGMQEKVERAMHVRNCKHEHQRHPACEPTDTHAEKERTRASGLSSWGAIHMCPNGRKVFIGDDHGAMSFCKSWKSMPIRSWSGGWKLVDMPGARANHAAVAGLSLLLQDEEPSLLAAAESLWRQLADHPLAAEAAQRMLHHISVTGQPCLGSTGWNAYSLNLDYRTAGMLQRLYQALGTGAHLDAKNVPGSFSALLILETGEAFSGGFYLLPQYRVALDAHQGTVIFHRSGDKDIGLHGNSGLYCPTPDSHRVALVLYLTNLGGDMRQGQSE